MEKAFADADASAAAEPPPSSPPIRAQASTAAATAVTNTNVHTPPENAIEGPTIDRRINDDDDTLELLTPPPPSPPGSSVEPRFSVDTPPEVVAHGSGTDGEYQGAGFAAVGSTAVAAAADKAKDPDHCSVSARFRDLRATSPAPEGGDAPGRKSLADRRPSSTLTLHERLAAAREVSAMAAAISTTVTPRSSYRRTQASPYSGHRGLAVTGVRTAVERDSQFLGNQMCASFIEFVVGGWGGGRRGWVSLGSGSFFIRCFQKCLYTPRPKSASAYLDDPFSK